MTTSTHHERLADEGTSISSRFLEVLKMPSDPASDTRSDDARQYRDLIDALGVAVYTTDAEGVITYYNEAAVELWGRRPEIGKDLWCGSWKIYQLDGTTIMPHGECPMAVCLKEDRPVRGAEAIAERPDGSRVYFRPFPTPLHDESGKLVGAINVLVDVTARKKTEEAAQHLAAVVASSEDAIISKTLDGTITSWNPAAERIFGYTAAEAIGQSVRLIIPADSQQEEDIVLERLRRDERIDHYETVRRRKDGTLLDVSLTISPIKDALGRTIGASKIARDVTEQKRAQAALLKLMAVKDEFIGLVSHELRTPITTVLGNALLLERRGDKLTEDSKKQAINDVVTEAERLQSIIENLLLLSRVGVDEQMETEPLLLRPIVLQAVDALQRRNPRRVVEVKCEGEMPVVRGQPEFVSLVVDNLVTNADKYSSIEAPIQVLVHANGGDDVEVCVRDYGIGLDESETEEVFAPFYRSSRAKSQAKGLGLGLAVCKRVLEAQGGSIRSVARPDGSDFIFKLKRYREDPD